MPSVEEWKRQIAPKVMKEIGIASGQHIVDFGCGTGIYDLIISNIIGDRGKIYAIDSDEKGLLKELLQEIKKLNIKNIEIIKTSGEMEFPIKDNSIDVVLFYDILHLMNEDQRDALFKESFRVLKKNGMLSYHATHLNDADNDFLEDIHQMMKKNGFNLTKTLQKSMFHWAWIQDSVIFNYNKIASR